MALEEKYQLDPADNYKYFETDWIQNDGRGNIKVDYEKFLKNERGQLRSKVKGQLSNFKNNLLSNVIRPFSGDIKTNFISDFFELNKVLEEAIENAPSGPAVDVKNISVAENLRSNSVEGYKQTLISQAFEDKLLPDGPIEVAYYDSNNKYTPKESWVVTNTGSGAEIVHTETGLKFQLDRDGLSFVDDNNFKINNKKINYESMFEPLERIEVPDNNSNVKNQVDASGKIQNYSMKGLDLLGKAVGPSDEALELGIPKLFANTALAPFAQGLIKTYRQLALANLGIAVTRGLYESKVMGENYQNLLQDPDNPEYIAERERLNQEGIQAFSDHMSTYDPSIRFIDSFTEGKLGFNQTDAATKVFGGIRNLFGGKK